VPRGLIPRRLYLHEDELDQYVPEAFPNRGPRRTVSKGAGPLRGEVQSQEGASEEDPAQTSPPPVMDGAVGSPNSSPFVRAG
jgi:hypothetical protein